MTMKNGSSRIPQTSNTTMLNRIIVACSAKNTATLSAGMFGDLGGGKPGNAKKMTRKTAATSGVIQRLIRCAVVPVRAYGGAVAAALSSCTLMSAPPGDTG